MKKTERAIERKQKIKNKKNIILFIKGKKKTRLQLQHEMLAVLFSLMHSEVLRCSLFLVTKPLCSAY